MTHREVSAMDFFSQLLDPQGFPARWNCGSGWSAGLGWLHIGSDLAIFAAYAAIPAGIAVILTRRKGVPFPAIGWLFAAFILACGCTHAIDALMFYYPIYRFLGLMKLATAIISLTTAVALLRLTPTVLALPAELRRTQDLERSTLTQRQQLEQLEAVRKQIEQRSAELTLRDRRIQAAMGAAAAIAVNWEAPTGKILWHIGDIEPLRPFLRDGVGWTAWSALRTPGFTDELRRRCECAAERVDIDYPIQDHSARPATLRFRAMKDPPVKGLPQTWTGMFRVVDHGSQQAGEVVL